MVIREYYITRKDGVNLYRTYSDKELKIQKVGTNEIYDEAVDVEDSSFLYEETDVPIDGNATDTAADDATEADYQEALRKMGVDL